MDRAFVDVEDFEDSKKRLKEGPRGQHKTPCTAVGSTSSSNKASQPNCESPLMLQMNSPILRLYHLRLRFYNVYISTVIFIAPVFTIQMKISQHRVFTEILKYCRALFQFHSGTIVPC